MDNCGPGSADRIRAMLASGQLNGAAPEYFPSPEPQLYFGESPFTTHPEWMRPSIDRLTETLENPFGLPAKSRASDRPNGFRRFDENNPPEPPIRPGRMPKPQPGPMGFA